MAPVQLPAAALQQLKGGKGETVFRAQINVDKKDYNTKAPPELSNNFITELIKEFHNKKTPAGATMAQGKGLGMDPSDQGYPNLN